MKKVFALLLTLALIATLSVASFAATGLNVSNGTNSESKDLTVAVDEYVEAGTVYSIDLNWTGTEFTYDEGSEGTWNVSEHKYNDAEDAKWSGAATVTVTNHSNTAIKASTLITPEDGYIFADVADVTVASAETNNAAETGTITINAPTSGVPTEDGTIANVTITLADAD